MQKKIADLKEDFGAFLGINISDIPLIGKARGCRLQSETDFYNESLQSCTPTYSKSIRQEDYKH